ncbi:hypothetical protein B484DRAFT_392998, partial [Ochromonadaceae sp. CCMP2298]
CVETCPVDIRGSLYEMKKKLLGTNASTIIQIVDSCGTKYNIRIRIRGMGSGFREGPNNSELNEPLHFNVSAESEQLLGTVMERLRAHVVSVKAEMEGGM